MDMSVRPVIRAMTAADIPMGLLLCRASGWNQVAEDWRCFLELAGGGCLLAEIEGQAAGSVAYLRYGQAFAWLSMMLVDPRRRGMGIGSQLMEAALAELRDESCVRLDATPLGEPLYRRFGFLPEYELARATITVMPGTLRPGAAARPAEPADLPRIFARDRECFGADRSALLASFYERAPRYAWLAPEGASVAGYCFGRPGHRYHHIGPIMADRMDVASELLSHCLAPHDGNTFAVDASRFAPEWIPWMESAGFAVERPFLRMYRGQRPAQGAPQRQFGIAGPEFG
jgi:GNAT superfamily N-acetyltransferase